MPHGSWHPSLTDAAHPDHLVQLYEHPAAREQTADIFLTEGLRKGQGLIVIARKSGWDGLLAGLSGQRGALVSSGQLTVLDAQAVLDKFLIQGIPDWTAFRESVGGLVASVRASRWHGIRIYSEIVDLLWQAGRHSAAIRLEEFWNDLAQLMPLVLFCAYRVSLTEKPDKAEPLEEVCRAHTQLVPSPDYCHLEQAVYESIEEVLGNEQLVRLKSLINIGGPSRHVPNIQAMLLWMRRYMPLTAEKVLSRSRRRYRQPTVSA